MLIGWPSVISALRDASSQVAIQENRCLQLASVQSPLMPQLQAMAQAKSNQFPRLGVIGPLCIHHHPRTLAYALVGCLLMFVIICHCPFHDGIF